MFNLFIALATASTLATNPNEAVFKLYEGNRLLNEGKAEQAIELVLPLDFYPHQPLKKFQSILKARALFTSSPDTALNLLSSAEMASAPWHEGVKHAESWGLFLKGEQNAALALLQNTSDASEFELLKAKLLLALGFPKEGLSRLEAFHPKEDDWNDATELLVVKALLLRENGELPQAIQLLQAVKLETINGFYLDYMLLILGKFYFEQALYKNAIEELSLLLHKYPYSAYRPDAFYWMARALENDHGDLKEIESIHRELISKHPDFPFADEVYFNQYTFKDYLQGDRNAVKHLDKFFLLHPKSPLTIVAFYLIGLDKERDRRSSEGKAIRRKNIMEAIGAFESAQKNYESLKPEEPYYLHVNHLAALERGRLLSQISSESGEPKKTIYRHYALDVLSPLMEEEREISSQAVIQLAYLAIADQELDHAKELSLNELRKWNQSTSLSVVTLNTLLGQIFQEQGDYELAWSYFAKAEELGAKGILNHDQELDLWIRQALCYQEMGQYDQAMLLFSKTINRNVVSSQRLRAMYLRAEVYQKQGRDELAKKQWEAVALKGGEWGQLAKKKLNPLEI